MFKNKDSSLGSRPTRNTSQKVGKTFETSNKSFPVIPAKLFLSFAKSFLWARKINPGRKL